MSSKRHVRRKSCSGKRKYADQSAAIAVAKRLGLGAYGCKFCHGFHIGHRPLKSRINPDRHKALRWVA
jgi:hypothetical protein